MTCYNCKSKKTVYLNFHGEEFYECVDCMALTSLAGDKIKSLMEDR